MGQLSYPAMLAEIYDQSDMSDVFEFRTAEDRVRHIQYQYATQKPPEVVFKTVRKRTPNTSMALSSSKAHLHAFKPLN